MFSTDYYINDLIGTAEKIRKALVERDDRIKLLTEQSNLGGFKPLQAYPEKNIHNPRLPDEETLATFINTVERTKAINSAIIAHNIKVKDCIVAFMESMGFRKEESSGSWLFSGRKPKKTVNGWYGEINSKIPVADNEYSRCQSYITDVRRQMVKAENDRVNAENAAKLEAEQEVRAKEAHTHLIQTCIKYNLSAVNLEELRDALMGRCKYLTLAYWLEKNRGDWSDGTDFAEHGLNAFYNHKDFDPDSVDTAIGAEISDLIGESWDGDGRCFRDCKFNYDELYSMVDAGLYEDFHKTVNLI